MNTYHNYHNEELFKALIDYVEARYKPLDIDTREVDDDWFIDIEKSKGETAWNLEREFPTELHQFIQDLINTFLMKDGKQIWVLGNDYQ